MDDPKALAQISKVLLALKAHIARAIPLNTLSMTLRNCAPAAMVPNLLRAPQPLPLMIASLCRVNAVVRF
jgi:hypothetical protein